MSYLAPDYEHDVFVSYSHGFLSESGSSRLKEWSRRMIQLLEGEIKDLQPDLEPLKIWMDPQLDPTQHLTAELRDTVSRSAILMVLMSPRYLRSQWCSDELEWFQAQVADRRDCAGRVFVVRAVPTDEDKWPKFIRDERGHVIPGFWFHPPNARNGGVSEPYGWHNPDQPEFLAALSTLRTALIGRLDYLKSRQTQAAAAAAKPRSAMPRLYLHARPQDATARDTIAEQLRAAGYFVTAPSPSAATDLASDIRESIARRNVMKMCDAMLMVRAQDDYGFIADLMTIRDECEEVREAHGKSLSGAVVDLVGTPLPEARQLDLHTFDATAPAWTEKLAAWLAAGDES
jgi:hypothetical protein